MNSPCDRRLPMSMVQPCSSLGLPPVKVLWLSANRLGYELLKEAVKISGFEVSGIITLSSWARTVMYDNPQGSWDDFRMPVYRVKSVNEEKKLIKRLSPDLVVMCGWRQIVDSEVLKIPPKGFVGFHPTLLPEGRGPSPIINSILSGFRKSGVTLFYVSEGLDDGDIIGQEEFSIAKSDHAGEVYDKVITAGKRLVRKYFPLLVSGKAPRTPQNHKKATVFEKRSLKDNEIDLGRETAEQAVGKIKAFSKPYRGAYIMHGKRKLVIWRAETEENEQVGL